MFTAAGKLEAAERRIAAADNAATAQFQLIGDLQAQANDLVWRLEEQVRCDAVRGCAVWVLRR